MRQAESLGDGPQPEQQLVLAAAVGRVDENMGGEGVVARGDRPGMDVVNQRDSRHLLHLAAKLEDVHVVRRAFQQHLEHAHEQAPGHLEDEQGDQDAQDGVDDDPVEVRQEAWPEDDERPGQDDADRTEQVGHHVLECPFHVQAFSSSPVQHPGRGDVHQQSDDADGEQQGSLHFRRLGEAVVGLEEYPAGNQPQAQGVDQRRQDFCPVETEG